MVAQPRGGLSSLTPSQLPRTSCTQQLQDRLSQGLLTAPGDMEGEKAGPQQLPLLLSMQHLALPPLSFTRVFLFQHLFPLRRQERVCHIQWFYLAGGEVTLQVLVSVSFSPHLSLILRL